MNRLLALSATLLLAACASSPVPPVPQGSADYIRTASAVPTAIDKRLRQSGLVSAPEPTRPLYAPLQPAEPFAGVQITRDVRYGTAERHRLDVFTPQGASGRPVLLDGTSRTREVLRRYIARRRVLAMRRTFVRHADRLTGIALIARKPA